MRFSSKRQRRKSAPPKPHRRAQPSRIKCTARSASPTSTSCIATRCACSPGATTSATRATGASGPATAPRRAGRAGAWRAPRADGVARRPFDPPRPGQGDSHSKEFSRRIGAKGWIGMTWPKKYGGRERTFLERYVVTEEFRVANAPVRLHFVADRQSGPILMKYAPENIKADILPRICRGEVCFAIGMSEPGSGSDLFAAKTQATKTNEGWR